MKRTLIRSALAGILGLALAASAEDKATRTETTTKTKTDTKATDRSSDTSMDKSKIDSSDKGSTTESAKGEPWKKDREAMRTMGPKGLQTKLVHRLHRGNLMEIEMGGLAQKNAGSEDVRKFAATLIEDHKKADIDLLNAAQRIGLSMVEPGTPAGPDDLEQPKIGAKADGADARTPPPVSQEAARTDREAQRGDTMGGLERRDATTGSGGDVGATDAKRDDKATKRDDTTKHDGAIKSDDTVKPDDSMGGMKHDDKQMDMKHGEAKADDMKSGEVKDYEARTGHELRPDPALRHHNAMMEELKDVKGAQFDKHFLTMMARDHKKTIDHVKHARQGMSSDDQLARVLDQQLPTMQRHLDTAQKLLKDLK